MVDEVMQKSRERMRNLKRSPRCRPAAGAAGRSAVDRIDDSAALDAAALLPEKTVVRKGFSQPGPDQRLDLAIRDADEVLRPFVSRVKAALRAQYPAARSSASRITAVASVAFNACCTQLFSLSR